MLPSVDDEYRRILEVEQLFSLQASLGYLIGRIYI